jgi:hypothetical protein
MRSIVFALLGSIALTAEVPTLHLCESKLKSASTSCAWDTRWCVRRPALCSPRRASAGPNRWARIHFANSDLSGFSIFEEAQYRGVQATRLL